MRERSQCLLEIDEISFTLNDLNLYLDTHPEDKEALTAFNQASTKRKQLMEAFAKEDVYKRQIQNVLTEGVEPMAALKDAEEIFNTDNNR